MRHISKILALVVVGSAASAESPPIFVSTWGTLGSGVGQFKNPWGIAITGDGSVLVADTWNHRIQRFGPNGVFQAAWGSVGSGNGQLYFPRGIAVDESNQVYVAEAGNNRIQKFDSSGNFLLVWGSSGANAGQFDFPYGVAVHSGGLVYVTDEYNHRVQAFQRDGSFVRTWGSYCELGAGNCGEGDGLFFAPRDIATDAAGSVYVLDAENSRVQKFDAQGMFLLKWGSSLPGDAQFATPTGVCTDAAGAVYVADPEFDRIKKFDGFGNLLSVWGVEGAAPGQLNAPTDVVAIASGAVYITEGVNDRVSKFSTATSSTEPLAGLETMALLPSANPVRGQAQLWLFLPRPASVRAQVFDARGQLVREAFTGWLPAGVQQLAWDGADRAGRSVHSGVYYIVVESDDTKSTRRVVLLK